MEIYINTVKKAVVSGRTQIYLYDIADIFASNALSGRIKNLKIYEIKENTDKEKKIIINIIDIIKLIDQALPGHTISSLGEVDTIVEYSPVKKKQSMFFLYSKVAFIFLVLMVGSSTAIMSFHTDAQLPQVFKTYSYILFNEIIPNQYLIDIPYSIGMAVGIIVFYNHFSKIKITNDPTPIEVEMTLYEQEVIECVVDRLNSQGKKESDEK